MNLKPTLSRLGLLLSLALTLAQSKPVDETTALNAARNFLAPSHAPQGLAKGSGAARKSPVLIFQAQRTGRTGTAHPGPGIGAAAGAGSATTSTPLYYVYGEPGKNFVIVSADDALRPILAYSTETGFDPAHLPASTSLWLQGYEQEIGAFLDAPGQASAPASGAWNALAKGSAAAPAAAAKLDPLIATKWGQGNFFNDQVPQKRPTGCVATAMAQIMKYWNYPAKGAGNYSYTHPDLGVLSADFSAATYAWQDMPNDVNGPNWAVANLMFQIGVSVEMDYTPTVSKAWIPNDDAHARSAQLAFTDNFSYKRSAYVAYRSNYDTPKWQALLSDELNAGRPVLYAGEGATGAHAFVCDGYDVNGLFHFNWGWTGQYNGYFALTAMNPGSDPGSTAGFNSYHYVLVGIEPRTVNPAPEITLMDPLALSAAAAPEDRFGLTAQIANTGLAAFTGTLKAVLYDSASKPRDLEAKANVTLAAGMTGKTAFTFTNPALQDLPPGKYSVRFLALVNGGASWSWVLEKKGSRNFAEVQLTRPELAITLEDNLSLSQAAVAPGQPFSLTTRLANRGTLGLRGSVCAAIHDSTGQFKAYLDNKSGFTLPASQDGKPTVVFATAGMPVLPPGTYTIYLSYMRGNGQWILIPETQPFKNRATLRITAPPPVAIDQMPGGLKTEWESRSGSLIVTSDLGLLDVRLLDVAGRCLFSRAPSAGTRSLRIPRPSNGRGPVYLRVRTRTGLTIRSLPIAE